MKILLVTDAYPPEIRSASHLMQELAEELKSRGHSITVITCQPKYNLVTPDIPNYEEYTDEDGIKIIRLNSLPHHKVNFIIRGLSQLTLPFIFYFKGNRYLRAGVDAVIVYSPPLPLWKVGHLIKKRYKAKFLLNIQDIFPQNAIDLGVLKNKYLVSFFESMEKQAYDAADSISVHSMNNREYLMKNKGIDPDKVHILHNWVDIAPFAQAVSSSRFRSLFGLEDKFIVFFGGVMGPSQGLDLVVEAASALMNEKDFVILIVGDGTEKTKLENLVLQNKLENVLIKPFVSKEDYQDLLKEVDVGLVSLTSKNKTPVVPGKILGYMAASLPVLAFLNQESDGHQIIKDANCGYSEIHGNAQTMSKLILKMYEEKEKLASLGKNGFRYAKKHFTKEVCINQLEEILWK